MFWKDREHKSKGHWFRWGYQNDPQCTYCNLKQSEATKFCKKVIPHFASKIGQGAFLFLVATIWNSLVILGLLSILVGIGWMITGTWYWTENIWYTYFAFMALGYAVLIGDALGVRR